MIIRVKNLRLRTIIGLNDWERKKEQDILINLKIQVDDETAVASDDLADGVDYKTIKYRIVEEVEKTSFFLIETSENINGMSFSCSTMLSKISAYCSFFVSLPSGQKQSAEPKPL